MIFIDIEHPDAGNPNILFGQLSTQEDIVKYVNNYFTISHKPIMLPLANRLLEFDKLILSTLSHSETFMFLEAKGMINDSIAVLKEIRGIDVDDVVEQLTYYKEEYYILHNIRYKYETIIIHIFPVSEVKNAQFDAYIRTYLLQDILQSI